MFDKSIRFYSAPNAADFPNTQACIEVRELEKLTKPLKDRLYILNHYQAFIDKVLEFPNNFYRYVAYYYEQRGVLEPSIRNKEFLQKKINEQFIKLEVLNRDLNQLVKDKKCVSERALPSECTDILDK